MPLTKKRLHDLLHEFKRASFRIDHSPDSLQAISQECKEVADRVLKEEFHYHFHKLPDANRVEIINMIHNYTTEAILPPIIARITERQVVLEKKLDHVVGFLERALEALSESGEPVTTAAD